MRSFHKLDSFETITVSPSGLSATIDISYVSKNDTSMTTVAEFFAIPELLGTEFSCIGHNIVTVSLNIAG